MNIELIPTLIDQFRETFEGEVRPGFCWITTGPPEGALLGTLEPLTAAEAYAPPVAEGKPVAAHVAHLRFALDLTLRRLRGEDPPADWAASFDLPPGRSPAAWEALKADVRRAYEGVLAFLEGRRGVPPQDWPPIHLAGLAAMTAHNAYHLGAIRQIARAVRARP